MKLTFAILCLAVAPNITVAQDGSRVTLEEPQVVTVSDGGEYRVEAGELRVRENRSRPESRTLKLAFGRLHATGEPSGIPLFFLPGGPGNAALPLIRSAAWRAFLELGDVVLMDPRGVGQSEPNLNWSSDKIDASRFFLDRTTAVEHMQECCRAAAQDLSTQDIDISSYNSIELAGDIAELAEALGYRQINLMGFSYGSHLGIAILRRHPELVNRFVSIGTAGTGDMQKLPSDLNRSLRSLSDLVASDAVIGEAMPDLYTAIEDLVDYLDEEPLPVPIQDSRTGLTRNVLLGPFGLQLLLVADLGDTSDISLLPRLVASLEERNTGLVSWFLTKRLRQFSSLPLMTLSVRGASGATESRWKQIQEESDDSPFGLARCLFSPESDKALGVGDVGDEFREPVESDVPTLFVSGTLDAHTPPSQAERVRRGFSNSGHVVVEFAGHEDLMPNPEVQELIQAFLAGAEPADVRVDGVPLRFAPLEGDVRGIDHPALDRGD